MIGLVEGLDFAWSNVSGEGHGPESHGLKSLGLNTPPPVIGPWPGSTTLDRLVDGVYNCI